MTLTLGIPGSNLVGSRPALINWLFRRAALAGRCISLLPAGTTIDTLGGQGDATPINVRGYLGPGLEMATI